MVNYERREVCSALQGHGMEINEIKPHPTKFGIILSTSKDQSVRVWNVQTSTVVTSSPGWTVTRRRCTRRTSTSGTAR